MSLDINKTSIQPIPCVMGEGRWGVVRLGMSASALKSRSVLESKNNRYHAPHHRYGGVGGVRMWRSSMERREEVLCRVKGVGNLMQQKLQAWERKGLLAMQEVGEVHNSFEVLVMRHGAKEPYLVAVNREGKDT